MVKCNICENKIQEQWKYCPECGIKIEESALEHEGYSIDRIRQPWIEVGGENFYTNFKSLQSCGNLSPTGIKKIRPNLGDYVGIHFSGIKTFSLLSIQPRCIRELCDIYRMIGYYGVDFGLKTTKLSKIVDVISKTGLFWKILTNQELQKAMTIGWKQSNEGIIQMVSMDAKNRQVTYKIEEGGVSYLESDKPLNFTDLNFLGGILEALCNMKCVGEERIEEGQTYFVYTMYTAGEEVEYPVRYIDETECNSIVEKLVEYIVSKKPGSRVKLEDKVHISGEQVETYFMLKSSEGHKILEKYAGMKCGRKIAEKAGLTGLDKSLDYVHQLLLDNKIGILHKPEIKGDRITLKMDESAYASGVDNIHMKLCIFIAGIMEGILKQSTDEKWLVEETKCLAKGDEHCQFTCKRI